MTTLIEEMARAIEGCCMEAEREPHLVWLDCDEAAQAALSVILKRLREPDKNLMETVATIANDDDGRCVWSTAANRIFRAIADHLEQDK